MADFVQCQREKCQAPAFSKVYYLNKFLCKKHRDELGDFDAKGKISDKRIKRQ